VLTVIAFINAIFPGTPALVDACVLGSIKKDGSSIKAE
jgi:hypothetical protein